MLTLGLIVIGAALVVAASTMAPRHLDPMGMFGLAPVRAIQLDKICTPKYKAARRTAILSQCAAWRCAEHASREAA